MSQLKDVACLAGVSVSTVSRVINASAFVEPETAKRVEEAIRKLNYRPNLLASGLKLKSSRLIGVVVPDLFQPLFVSLIQYISEYCHYNDYEVVIGLHHDSSDEEAKIIDGFLRRNVDGLLLSLVSDESRVFEVLYNSDVPTVIFDRVIQNTKFSAVVLDNYMAGCIVAEYLISLGHRNIACIGGPEVVNLSRERMRGFSDMLAKHGVDLLQRNIRYGDFGFSSGYNAVSEIVYKGRTDIPTAIWAQNDMMALGAIRYLNNIGMNVPGDISIIGMDNNFVSEITSPSLTTVSQPLKAMSKKAVDLFLAAKKASIQNEVFTFQPRLIVRESTFPIDAE